MHANRQNTRKLTTCSKTHNSTKYRKQMQITSKQPSWERQCKHSKHKQTEKSSACSRWRRIWMIIAETMKWWAPMNLPQYFILLSYCEDTSQIWLLCRECLQVKCLNDGDVFLFCLCFVYSMLSSLCHLITGLLHYKKRKNVFFF